MDWKGIDRMDWVQPSVLSRSYEIRLADRVMGTLEFESTFGSRATARAGESRWTFKRTGFFSPKVTARVEGTEIEVARYEPVWTGTKGTLYLPGGERLQLRASNFWNSEWMLEQENGGEIMRLHTRGVMHQGASVELAELGRSREDVPLLAAIGWYILLLYISDAAATTAAIG